MTRAGIAASVLLIASVFAPAPPAAGARSGQAPQPIADVWDKEHVSWPVPPLIRHTDVESRLRDV